MYCFIWRKHYVKNITSRVNQYGASQYHYCQAPERLNTEQSFQDKLKHSIEFQS